jgi:hypothetical protein
MDYIKESFWKKMNIQYWILFNKIKFNLDSDLSELEKVIISKEIIKQYINQWIIWQYFNPNPWKNRWIRLTKSKEKYIDLWNWQYFEIKRKID